MQRLVTLNATGGETSLHVSAVVRRQVRALWHKLQLIEQSVPETTLGMAAREASDSLLNVLGESSPVKRRRPPQITPDHKTNALPKGDR